MTTIPVSADQPAPMERSTSIRRALLFLLVCSPAYLLPGTFSAGGPVAMLALVLVLTYLFLRSEGRTLAVLGIESTWRRLGELAAGLAGGALLIGVSAVCVRLLLPFPWARNPQFDLSVAAYSALWFLVGNSVEELIFRGYSFERLIAGIGHWRAQLITALLFAVFHIAQGWPWQVALVGTTFGSLLFGSVFARWRSVPAAAGVHVAANWVKDLLLSDPPTAKTLFAPLSPRPWTSSEQWLTLVIFNGVVLLVCAGIWWSGKRNQINVALGPTEKAVERI